MMAKPMKTLELHYPMNQFLIKFHILPSQNYVYLQKKASRLRKRYQLIYYYNIKLFFALFTGELLRVKRQWPSDVGFLN